MHTRFGTLGILVMLASPAAGQQVFMGQGEGTVVRNIGYGAFRGAPLLDGFYFRFGPRLGRPSSEDEHFAFIEVGADRPFVSRLTAGLGDKGSDNRFAYVLSFHPRYGADTLVSTETFLGAVEFTRTLPRPASNSVFVLRGFRLSWDGGDQHLRRLAIKERAGQLTVAVEGGTGGLFLGSETFLAQVDYAYLPRKMVQRRSTTSGASLGGGADQAYILRGQSVLAGFDLRFTDDDHHVREIGVMTPDDGRVQVFFGDKGADDDFAWSVNWVVLKRDPRDGIDRPGPGLAPFPGAVRPEPGRTEVHDHGAPGIGPRPRAQREERPRRRSGDARRPVD